MNTPIILLIIALVLVSILVIVLLTKDRKKAITQMSLHASRGCSGPDFTNKKWNNILSGSDVKLKRVSFSKDNPLKILAQNNYGDTLVYSTVDGGKNWKKLSYSNFNNRNPVRLRVFKNFQLAFDNMNNVYLSTDMFETISKTYDLKPQLPTNNWLASWDQTICGSDDGSVIFIPVFPQSPSNVTGFVKIMIDANLNLTVKYTQLTDQYNTSMCCSSDAKYVCYTSFQNNNDIFAYLSQDFGETWQSVKVFGNISPAKLTSVQSMMNANGNCINITGTLKYEDVVNYFISSSIDFGNTWKNIPSFSEEFIEYSNDGWTQLSLSTDSSNNLVITGSRDMGNSFFNITTSGIEKSQSSQDTVIGQIDKNITIPMLTSLDGNFSLKSQNDANLVVYDKSGKAYWNSFSTNPSNFPQCVPINSCTYTTQLQTDGNLVTYSDKPNKNNTNFTWSAFGYPGSNFVRKSNSSAPYTLKLWNSGNIGIYDSNGNIIWSTGDIPSMISSYSSFGNIIISSDDKTIIAVINGSLYSLM